LFFAALSANAGAQSFPPAWSASANGYAGGDLVAYNQNYYRALQAQAKGAIKSLVTSGYWELSELRFTATPMKVGNQTGDTFKTFQQAWQFIANARIDPGASITIVVDQAPPVFTQPLNLDHPFGSQIFIQGTSQTNVNFLFDACDGIVLDNAHVLGGLSNLTLEGTNRTGNILLTSGTRGMLVSSNAVLNTQNVTINSFDTGAQCQGGGTLILGVANHPDWIDNFQSNGVYATDHSLIDIRAPLSYGGLGLLSGQEGIHCSDSAEIKAPGCSVTNCAYDDFLAETGGYIIATSAYADGGGGISVGFHSKNGGIINANDSTANGAKTAYLSEFGSKLYAEFATIATPSTGDDFVAYMGSFIATLSTTGSPATKSQTDGTTGSSFLGTFGSLISQ
jgi:hypothetical protein